METTAKDAVVCDDPDLAADHIAAGRNVVLIVSPEDGGEGPRLPALSAGGGRLALLAGRPGDPQAREAARAMADELFGPRSSSGRPT